MKKALIVLVAFCVVSVLLTWVWNEWLRELYAALLKIVAPPVYELIGFGGARVGAYRDRYINFVPFVSLVAVTPGLGLRRRTLGLALGCLTLFASHIALNLTERLHPGPSLPILPALFSDTLPFLLWLVVAYPVLVALLPNASSAGSNDDAASDHGATRTGGADGS